MTADVILGFTALVILAGTVTCLVRGWTRRHPARKPVYPGPWPADPEDRYWFAEAACDDMYEDAGDPA